MLIDNWRKLSNVELGEDERTLALWEIFHLIKTTPKYTKWCNALTFRFNIDNSVFEDEMMDCFIEKYYVNKIKPNTNEPLPTIEKFLEDMPAGSRRNYTENKIEGKIYKYIFNTIRYHFINKFRNNNNLTLLDRIELQDYEESRSSKIQLILSENIDEISNDPYFRGEEVQLETHSLQTSNEEVNIFLNYLVNWKGYQIALKSLDFLRYHEFCFWLIKRSFDFADRPDLFTELRNEYELYAARTNLPQDLTRCRTSFQNNVLNTRNG